MMPGTPERADQPAGQQGTVVHKVKDLLKKALAHINFAAQLIYFAAMIILLCGMLLLCGLLLRPKIVRDILTRAVGDACQRSRKKNPNCRVG